MTASAFRGSFSFLLKDLSQAFRLPKGYPLGTSFLTIPKALKAFNSKGFRTKISLYLNKSLYEGLGLTQGIEFPNVLIGKGLAIRQAVSTFGPSPSGSGGKFLGISNCLSCLLNLMGNHQR